MADPASVSGDVLSPEQMAASVARADAQHGNAGGTQTRPREPGDAAGVAYKYLKQSNPEYDAGYWRRLRALYKGGRALLGDQSLMSEIFPRHRKEIEELYQERCRRAFYIPYAAEIIDHIVAGLAADPITVNLGDESEGKEELPTYYAGLLKDVSPKGGKAVPLTDHVKAMVREALLVQCAWAMVDLPIIRNATGEPVPFSALAEQEQTGALDAYVVMLEREAVIDWEEDDSGELYWAMLHTASNRRMAIAQTRNMITRTWTVYTREAWAKYEITYRDDQAPKDDDIIPLVDQGAHTFGRVPLIRLDLPDGLWAMNKMEGLAREHFNKRAALAWGELQSLLPELYEFLGPEMGGKGTVIGQAQEEPGRATALPRGQGFVQVRGSEDDARFVGPDAAPFTEARSSCDNLRDELHRVMHQMALSVDNSAASVGRSAESKAQDKAAVAVILTELGNLARAYAEALLSLTSRARQDLDLLDKWSAQGMAKFDAISVADAIEQALSIDMLHIESPTFRKRHRLGLIRAILADDATEEDMDQIEKELEESITDETVNPPPLTDEERGAAPGGEGGAGGTPPGAAKRRPTRPFGK